MSHIYGANPRIAAKIWKICTNFFNFGRSVRPLILLQMTSNLTYKDILTGKQRICKKIYNFFFKIMHRRHVKIGKNKKNNNFQTRIALSKI